MSEQVALLVLGAALHRHVVPQAGERRLEPFAAVDDHQLRFGQATRQQIVEHGAPSGFGLTAHVPNGEHHLLAVAADPERDQQRDGGRSAIEPDLDHGAIENQPHDVVSSQIAPLPGLPGGAGLVPSTTDGILADAAGKQGLEGPAHPTGVDAGEVDPGDQQLGAPAQAPVGRQQCALPLALAGLVVREPRPRHRQHQRPERRVQSTLAVAVAMPLPRHAALVAASSERGRELLLQKPFDEATHLTTDRLFQRIEPVGAQAGRWRRRRGWRTFVHGVGSSSARPWNLRHLFKFPPLPRQDPFERCGADLETYRYKTLKGVTDGVPWVAEAAFACLLKGSSRLLVSGINWSPALRLGDDPFGLSYQLASHWCGHGEPIMLLAHLICP